MQSTRVPHGRAVLGPEPVVFHCNHFNYWLQKTLLLDGSLGMGQVIEDAAAEGAFAVVSSLSADAQGRLAAAAELFRSQGFGTLDLREVTREGGVVHTPTSHYGQSLRVASGADFAAAQNLFDRGFVRGALSAAYGVGFQVSDNRCFSMGAARAGFRVSPGGPMPAVAVGVGLHTTVEPVPPAASSIDEAGVIGALAGLDLSGNEEGFIPRFGVLLTNHYANFYNRISFEFVRRMRGSGMVDEAEQLLVDAGYRCAFNTFGGVMLSGEWDAVVKPQCTSEDDWIHGMVAVINTLGWGTWRIRDLTDDRLVVRIYDDYESAGYRAMYGLSDRPACFLHQGGVSGLMHLVRYGRLYEQPELTPALFDACFEVEAPFAPRVTSDFAQGDPYTEIIAERV